jgi:hypothetical protein
MEIPDVKLLNIELRLYHVNLDFVGEKVEEEEEEKRKRKKMEKGFREFYP